MKLMDKPGIITSCLAILCSAFATLLHFSGMLCFLNVFYIIYYPEYIEYPLSDSLISWLINLCFGIIFSFTAGFTIFRLIRRKKIGYLCMFAALITAFALSTVISYSQDILLTSYFTVSILMVLGARISIRTLKSKASKSMSKPNIYLAFFSLLPIAWYVLFFSFVLRGWNKIGFMPRPNYPDPKNLNLDLHYFFIVISTFVVGLSPVSLIHPRLQLNETKSINCLTLFFVANYFIWWLFLILDPGHFREWFID